MIAYCLNAFDNKNYLTSQQPWNTFNTRLESNQVGQRESCLSRVSPFITIALIFSLISRFCQLCLSHQLITNNKSIIRQWRPIIIFWFHLLLFVLVYTHISDIYLPLIPKTKIPATHLLFLLHPIPVYYLFFFYRNSHLKKSSSTLRYSLSLSLYVRWQIF